MWKAHTNHLYWGKILLWQEHPTKMVPTILTPPPIDLIKFLFPYLNLSRIFCHEVTGSIGMNFQILWHQLFPTGPTLCFGHNTQTRLSVLSLKLNLRNSSIDTQQLSPHVLIWSWKFWYICIANVQPNPDSVNALLHTCSHFPVPCTSAETQSISKDTPLTFHLWDEVCWEKRLTNVSVLANPKLAYKEWGQS